MRGSLVKIKRGIELAKKGKFEQASKIYNSLKDIKIEDKDSFEILKRHIKEFEHTEKLKLKNKLKEHLSDALDKKDYSSAMTHYKKAKKVYMKIPDMKLRDLLSKTHKKIVTEHNITGSEKLKKGISEIEDLMKISYDALKAGNKGKALSYYKEIRDLKSKLPAGFAKQKKALVSDILKLHKEIVASKGEIGETVDQINKLVEKIEVSLSKNEDAQDDYNKIMGLYSTLSPDYLESNDTLSKRIKNLGDRVTRTKLKSDRKIISNIKDKIASVLSRVRGNKQKYSELVTLYSKMPKSEEKKKAKKTILKVYNEHVLENDDEHLKEYGNDVKRKYKDLLKFVIDFHNSIENGLFEDLGGQVKQIKKIFDSLPVGLARGDAKLVNDVKKISLEADLYSRVMKLKKLSGEKLKKSLDMIYVDTKRLERNSHDMPLFDYVKSICGQYSLDMMSLTEEKQMRKHVEEAEKHEAEIFDEKKFLSDEVSEKKWYNVFSWFKNDKIEAPTLPEAEIPIDIPKPITVDEDDIVNSMTKRDLDKIERARVLSNKKLSTLASNLSHQEAKLDNELDRKLKHETEAIERVREKSLYSEMNDIRKMSNEELNNIKKNLNKMEEARITSNRSLSSKAQGYAKSEDNYHSKLMKDAHFIEMVRRKSLANEVGRVKGMSSNELNKIQRDLDKIERVRVKSNSELSSQASAIGRQEEIADRRLSNEESENAHVSKFVYDADDRTMNMAKPNILNRPIKSLMKRVNYNEHVRKMMDQKVLDKIENARLRSNRALSSRASTFARQEDKADIDLIKQIKRETDRMEDLRVKSNRDLNYRANSLAKQEDFMDLKMARQEKLAIDRIEHVRQMSNARVHSVLRKIEKNYPAENPELVRLQEVESKINAELEKLPATSWAESNTHSIISDMPDFSVEISSKRTVSLPLDKMDAYKKRLEIVKRKLDEEIRGFS